MLTPEQETAVSDAFRLISAMLMELAEWVEGLDGVTAPTSLVRCVDTVQSILEELDANWDAA